MSDPDDIYVSPLVRRYAGRAMCELWGEQRKVSIWRRLWLALAEGEKQLGLDISDEQIAQLGAHLDDIDFDKAGEYERKFRHDVMAHVHAFGDAAPAARCSRPAGSAGATTSRHHDQETVAYGPRAKEI